mmetsp:Transcript_20352/g.45273  ORF Transcript_20352/g.45273 Transcript_20352/m.45273 type:complete len:233 (+) Transcript_20352:1286-1984(+)
MGTHARRACCCYVDVPGSCIIGYVLCTVDRIVGLVVERRARGGRGLRGYRYRILLLAPPYGCARLLDSEALVHGRQRGQGRRRAHVTVDYLVPLLPVHAHAHNRLRLSLGLLLLLCLRLCLRYRHRVCLRLRACASAHLLAHELPQSAVVLHPRNFKCVIVRASRHTVELLLAPSQFEQTTHVRRRYKLILIPGDEQCGHAELLYLKVRVPLHEQHQRFYGRQYGQHHVHHV